MPEGNYRHFLKLYLRDEIDPLIEEVRAEEINRLKNIAARCEDEGGPNEFFWFDTVDGKSLVINLRLLQAVHFLWEPTPLPPEPTRYEGAVMIALRGRKEKIETDTEAPEQLYDFFSNLEHGPEVVPFPSFEDEDGERLMFNASEIVFALAPLHLIREGKNIVMAELEDTEDEPETGDEPEDV